MKPLSQIPAMLALAAFGLAVSATAADNPSRMDVQRRAAAMAQASENRQGKPISEEADDGANPVLDTMSQPFRLLGRSGATVVRSPLIIGETIAGDRKLVTERGLFMKTERAGDVRRTIPTGRGERQTFGGEGSP